jgi:hypothetical protein
MIMRFIDFKMRDLIGQTVAWKTSDTVNRKTEVIIDKISETNKLGFRIEGRPEKLFSYKHGHEILPEGRKRLTYGTVSLCQLVTDEHAGKIVNQTAIMAAKKQFVQFITDNQNNLWKLPLKDLKTFVTKIKKLNEDGTKRETS